MAAKKQPNILVIFGDDIGVTNISAYGQGIVGYRTPNIDRVAHEGMMFTDYYAENGMIEHDTDVGKLLDALDELGIADNTIVVYTTDNGPNQFSWPDAAMTPFRSDAYRSGDRKAVFREQRRATAAAPSAPARGDRGVDGRRRLHVSATPETSRQ